MTIGIYALYWEKQDLVYIGRSANIERRVKQHIRNLQNNKHPNYKVQEAYNLFGLCNFPIIEICEEKELNLLEEFWQKEFNSLSSLDIVQAGECHASGLTNPRAKYSKLDLLLSYRLCRNPNLTSQDISLRTKVSLSMVDDIRSGRAHIWLQTTYPFTWKLIQSSREQRRINGYERSKRKLNKVCVFKSPEGIIYEVNNFAKFGREHGLDSSDLSRVASGKYTHTKGWAIVKEVL